MIAVAAHRVKWRWALEREASGVKDRTEINASSSTKTLRDREHDTCPQAPESLRLESGRLLSEQRTSSVAIAGGREQGLAGERRKGEVKKWG
jgi:hypothetical protein